MEHSPDQLKQKVGSWLANEGYPLEFRTANAFRQAGFHVRQAEYVSAESENTVREIDVTASKTLHVGPRFVRIYHVIECKWTKDKPWVVFTAPQRITPAACVTQTFSSLLGESILWTIAGLPSLHNLSLFATPERPGFSGRQALAPNNSDIFYNTMRSVTSVALDLLRWYDSDPRKPGAVPEFSVVAFPLVVIEGRLFESYHEAETGELVLEERQHLRLHWRGSPKWHFHATIDIVTVDGLEAFVTQRSAEVDLLSAEMIKTLIEIEKCAKSRALDCLTITKGGRGVVGLPTLLREVVSKEKPKATKHSDSGPPSDGAPTK